MNPMFLSRSAAWLLLAVVVFGSAGLATAQTKTRYSTAELIAENSSLPADGGVITLGLYLEPDAGWHTYWANPGDAGKGLSIDWKLPEGFEARKFVFPIPTLLPLGELNTYGYEAPILVLIELSVPAGLPIEERFELGGRARWVVCDDEICVPDRARVSVALSVGEGGRNANTAHRFDAARSKIPKKVEWPAQFSVDGNKVGFQIAPADVREGFDGAYLFVVSPDLVAYDQQTVRVTDKGLFFEMDAAGTVDGSDGVGAVLTYRDAAGETQAVELELTKTTTPLGAASNATGSTTATTLSFATAALFAFLGGVILNLMPCVFPILSMKALSLVTMGGDGRRLVRQSGLIYTLGILVAFSVVAAVMLVLRSAGEAVGWGFQMQNPSIVVGLGLLMVAIGMNLLGAFEFGTSVVNVGQGLVNGGERRAAFFTGLLAVVVATPCMAPFMASALGYALTQPAAISFTVFLSLGFGLAFPYLALSLAPSLNRFMPKPGAWMATFKQVLAFPMFVTALWLFWIVGQQLGATSMFIGLLAAIALAFTLWAYGNGRRSGRKTAWYGSAAIGLLAGVFAVLQVEASRVVERQNGDSSAGTLGGLQLENFEPTLVTQYVADGQPTFVYFTADWCISCKANERVALATDEVADAFAARGITVVEGDWTREDSAITEWLAYYDRVGVPLYLYYPTGSSLESAAILPQILTPRIVIDAIDAADKKVLTGVP